MNLSCEYYRKRLAGGEPAHYLRYCQAALWIEPLTLHGATVLDCGDHESPFRRLIRREWPQVNLIDTGSNDLRYPLPIESESLDLVLCMEVLEHLKDRTEDDRATFTGSGIRSLLAEVFRILKPGGRLFLSTPNLACWHSIRLLLMGFHPYFFQPHHREMTWNEISAYLDAAGFCVERCETLDVWNRHGLSDSMVEELKVALPTYSAGAPSRGDCIFAIAGKH